MSGTIDAVRSLVFRSRENLGEASPCAQTRSESGRRRHFRPRVFESLISASAKSPYEVEGRVTDRKPHDFTPFSGGAHVAAGEPVHDMGVRLVYDEQLRVHDVHTFTNASPYAHCPEGGRALQSLKGLRMVSGWSKEVKSRLGGARSCTHLMELLMPEFYRPPQDD